jgi:YHS domain-containing protein
MKHILLFITVVFATATNAQTSAVRVKQFNIEKGIAIQGYDPVSYFKNSPQKGNAQNTVSYNGISYYFANAENKSAFQKNPLQYEPQCGGWCAYAMAVKGEKIEINPSTYKIIDGKLFLFYNAYFNNTLKSWNKEEKTLKPKVETNWNKFIK